MAKGGLAVEPHLLGFMTMLDESFRRYGCPDGLPPRLRDAVLATPRHRFVHRFRLRDGGSLQDFDADPVAHLATVYSDAVMAHVDDAGDRLPSTNSQPSYVLWLVGMLGIEPGHRVLEVGSGSGWLAAVMGHLAGAGGQVTGVEIIPDLAEQSRRDLAGVGIGTVAILTHDATGTGLPGGLFDRVMITAAAWDLPEALRGSVADGGRLLVPIALEGGGCQVTLLRRVGVRFEAEGMVPGAFVPLIGSGQGARGRTLADLPFWTEIGDAPSLSCPFWLGNPSPGQPGPAARCFRAFLRLSEPGFLAGEGRDDPERLVPPPFGLVDEASRSVAICRPGELVGFGEATAARRLVRAYERWTRLGMPGPDAFTFALMPSERAPGPEEGVYVERRGESAFVWRLKPGATAWRQLLE